MKTRISLSTALLAVSFGALADQSTLAATGTQLAMGKAPSDEVVKEQTQAVGKVQQGIPSKPEALQTPEQQLKEAAKQKLQQATPDEVKQGVETLEKAKGLKQEYDSMPADAKEQAKDQLKDAAQQKLQETMPEPIKQGTEAVEKAKELKGTIDTAPKSTDEAVDAVKGKAKEKATEKALELLR